MDLLELFRLVKREKELAEKEENGSVGIVYCGDFNNVAIGTTICHALGSPITGNEVDMFSSGKSFAVSTCFTDALVVFLLLGCVYFLLWVLAIVYLLLVILYCPIFKCKYNCKFMYRLLMY